MKRAGKRKAYSLYSNRCGDFPEDGALFMPGKKKVYSSQSYRCGEFPEDGAIFMSSRATREECLDRNLFGLPMAYADFVEAVKSGMTLFLFEYESRELYGVFEAVSNGQLDINPRAWSSSHKAFPAQVCVRVIWDCYPIPESEFRKVISDNYYNKNKFNFGLSRLQVDRLLQLFIPRTQPEKPLRTKKVTKRQTITLGDLRELITTQGKDNSHASEHEEPDELTTLSASKQSEHGQVKDYPAVLGDYIPLSPVTQCDVEINVKAVYSIKSEQGSGGIIPRLNLLPLLDSIESSRDARRESIESDLVPCFLQQMEENATREAGRSVNDECQGKHVTVRKSVFSRLTFD